MQVIVRVLRFLWNVAAFAVIAGIKGKYAAAAAIAETAGWGLSTEVDKITASEHPLAIRLSDDEESIIMVGEPHLFGDPDDEPKAILVIRIKDEQPEVHIVWPSPNPRRWSFREPRYGCVNVTYRVPPGDPRTDNWFWASGGKEEADTRLESLNPEFILGEMLDGGKLFVEIDQGQEGMAVFDAQCTRYVLRALSQRWAWEQSTLAEMVLERLAKEGEAQERSATGKHDHQTETK